MNQEEVRYLNQLRNWASRKISEFLQFPVSKGGFIGLLYQIFKEQITTVFYQMFYNTGKEKGNQLIL